MTEQQQPRAPFVIGTETWPGLAKLAEECGELLQVIGKLIAYPDGDHPDGGRPLEERLADELADVAAACEFVAVANGHAINLRTYNRRVMDKASQFDAWHEQALEEATS